MSNAIPGLGWAKLPKTFQLGYNTLAVPMKLHKSARLKLVDEFGKLGISDGIVLLESGDQACMYDTDTEILFKPNSWFNYLFGTKEPGLYGILDIKTKMATLFIPKLDHEYTIWCGAILPPEHFKEIYDVDNVEFTESLSSWLGSYFSINPGAKLHLLSGLNTDSGSMVNPPTFDGIEQFKDLIDTDVLHKSLSIARLTKSDLEINLMWYCAYVATNAHVAVMRSARPGVMEYELEAQFLYEIYRSGGCRRSAYTSICACGPNAAVLHYGHAAAANDRYSTPGDMALLDMGAEYHGYVSDITCSFPLSGKFTADQRGVYEGVLAAQRVVLENMRPGVSWVQCHRFAEREILKGILLGSAEDVDKMVAAHLGAIFFPHGLGHLIGCDTHDVGGYLSDAPSRPAEPGVKKLRTSRVLQAGMVLTNEPGCYFIDSLLDAALANPEQAKFINTNTLARFRGFGGVRLEDVVLVTENGACNLTSCPRLVEEIESVMSGGSWPPLKDAAPYLLRKWGKLSPESAGM